MKRGPQRTSVIWKPSKKEFQEIVNNSNTLADILRHFELHVGAGNYPTLKRRIKEDGIDISHITLGLSNRKGRTFPKEQKPVHEYLVKGECRISGTKLKKKLFTSGLLKDSCAECGLGNEWNGKTISLTIDHINGDSSDNRLDNLRILCPNCHSQTETFSGRHKHHKRLASATPIR
jgi:hypothetical protein